MKFSNICIFIVSMMLLAANASAQTRFVGADNGFIQYEGRINFTNKAAPMFCYPGTTIRACFTGTSVSMKMKPGSGYYMVSVDNKDYDKINFDGQDSVICIAKGLAPGRHTIVAMLANEEFEGHAEFYGFFIDENAKLVDMGKDERPLIEFIGDSMTCGYGSEASDGTIHYDPSNSNFFYTYAAIAARELNARLMVVARSGMGVYRNYNGKYDGSIMPQWYGYTLIYDDSQRWNPEGNMPDVLCINLGTNDFSTTGGDFVIYRDSYERFVRYLRSLYPKTKIVMLSGCMLSGEPLKVQNAALDEVQRRLKTEGDDNIFRFDFTPQDGSLGYGADWHPSKAQHRKMADELVPYLRTIADWGE